VLPTCRELGMGAWLQRPPCSHLCLASCAMCEKRFARFSLVQPISDHIKEIYYGLIGLLTRTRHKLLMRFGLTV
jgi:hypothetical protein